MKTNALALAIALTSFSAAAAAAQSGEPSVLACDASRSDAARVLASHPDSLQVNNLLFEAARKGCIGSLDVLRKAGASPMARDRGGNTALAIASRMGRLPFVEALLRGAAPTEAAQLDSANVAGTTPLIQAALGERTDVARALIDAGAKVDLANAQGETALSVAAFTGNSALAALLLERGAKPDATDATGKAVIVYAAARGAAEIVGRLLDAGVDPNARYRAGLTALMWAAGHADNVAAAEGLRTVKLLIARGAAIDPVDDRGRDALMIAAALGHGAITQALIEAGADPNRRDKTGKTAADLAPSSEIRAIVAAR